MRAFRALIWLAITSVVLSGVAGAEEPPGGRYVSVVYVGSAEDAELLRDVLRELLGRLDVSIRSVSREAFQMREVFTPGGKPDRQLVARAWFDLRGAERAHLYVVDPPWERVLVRDVPLEGSVDEVAREQMGHILEAAVETLLTGGRIGKPRAQVQAELGAAESPAVPPPKRSPRPPKPVPQPPPPEAEAEPAATEPGVTITPALGAHWGLQGLSSTEPVAHGPELRFSLRLFDGDWQPGVGVGAQYRLPVVTSGHGIDVRLDTLALRLRPHIWYRAHPRVALLGGIGIGLDLVHVEPRTDQRGSQLEPSRWTVVPFVLGTVATRVRLVDSVWLEGAFTLDFDLVDSFYFTTRPGRSETVLDPWSVRPGGSLGLSLEL